MFICMRKISFISGFFFWVILKAFHNWYFANFGNVWPSSSKIKVSICRKRLCLSACKNSTSSLTSFLKYYKEIANLLFRVIWKCLATHTKDDSINLRKFLMFICRQKKTTSFLVVFFTYCEDIENLLFWVL